MKRSVTKIAAWITGTAAILAAIISGSFLFFSPSIHSSWAESNESTAVFENLNALFEFRASCIRSELDKQEIDASHEEFGRISEVKKRFEELHQRNLVALSNRDILLAYSIQSEINDLLFERQLDSILYVFNETPSWGSVSRKDVQNALQALRRNKQVYWPQYRQGSDLLPASTLHPPAPALCLQRDHVFQMNQQVVPQFVYNPPNVANYHDFRPMMQPTVRLSQPGIQPNLAIAGMPRMPIQGNIKLQRGVGEAGNHMLAPREGGQGTPAHANLNRITAKPKQRSVTKSK